MVIEKDCDRINSVVHEVIRSVLNLLFFIQSDFTSTKMHKKEYNALKSTTNLRFINLKFIGIRFIDLKFIDINSSSLKNI